MKPARRNPNMAALRRLLTRSDPSERVSPPPTETWDEIERRRNLEAGFIDLPDAHKNIMERVRPHTLTSRDRVAALCAAVDYITTHAVPGAIVECGLWRGGSLFAALLRLVDLGVRDREIVGFDTFAGMTEPSAEDVDYLGKSWVDWRNEGRIEPGTSCGEIRELLASSGYPMERVRLVAGDVRQTIPGRAPEKVSLLRLDTDWYSTTSHELAYLYPRVADGGVLIVDDYGHYRGARKAVDEYFAARRIFLHRIDYTGRIAIKQSSNVSDARPVAAIPR